MRGRVLYRRVGSVYDFYTFYLPVRVLGMERLRQVVSQGCVLLTDRSIIVMDDQHMCTLTNSD